MSNTIIIGLLILSFSTFGFGTPIWMIVGIVFCYGFFTSLQYTSMNTLVYADVVDSEASAASSIASTMQQMSMSFGVAGASLVTAILLPDRYRSDPPQFIHGIHHAFYVLGALTVLSTLVFQGLKKGDGGEVSQARQEHPG